MKTTQEQRDRWRKEIVRKLDAVQLRAVELSMLLDDADRAAELETALTGDCASCDQHDGSDCKAFDTLITMRDSAQAKAQRLQQAFDQLWSGVDNVTRWDSSPGGVEPDDHEISETGDWVLYGDLQALLRRTEP